MDANKTTRAALTTALRGGHAPTIMSALRRLGWDCTEYAHKSILVKTGGGWVLLWECGDHWRVNGRRVCGAIGIRREASRKDAAEISSRALVSGRSMAAFFGVTSDCMAAWEPNAA